jgi:hypothetical protein
MSRKTVRVVNRSESRLPIPWGKNTIVFAPRGQPGSVQDLPEDAAEYCRGHYGEMLGVIEPTSVVESFVEEQKHEEFYVANMTGDPDAAEFVGEYRNLRTDKMEKERNDNKQPQELKYRLGRFQTVDGRWTTNDKPVQVTTPGKLLRIEPYTRKKVTRGQFETIMALDISAPMNLQGRVCQSRAPSDFEPNFDDPWWTIDRMRTWLSCIPGTGTKPMGRDIAGPSEAEIRAGFADEDEADVAVSTARFDMWVRCFMRAANLQFKLPSRKEFDASLARDAKAAKKKESAASSP